MVDPENAERAQAEALELHTHDGDEEEAAAAAASVIGEFVSVGRGALSVLGRVGEACRGWLSSATAWASTARHVIATIAHTTAALAGLA